MSKVLVTFIGTSPAVALIDFSDVLVSRRGSLPTAGVGNVRALPFKFAPTTGAPKGP